MNETLWLHKLHILIWKHRSKSTTNLCLKCNHNSAQGHHPLQRVTKPLSCHLITSDATANACMPTAQSTEGLLWRLGEREGCNGYRETPPFPTLLLTQLTYEALVYAVKVQRAPVRQWGACFGRGRPTAGGVGSVGWGLWSGAHRLALRLQQMAAEQRGCGETRTVR